MHFTEFTAFYDRKSGEHEYDYYPLRNSFSTQQISKELDCPVEYVRNVVKTLGEEQAELKTIFNQDTRRNETTWYIHKAGYESITKKWIQDKDSVRKELKVLGATDADIEAILKSFHTPLKEDQKVRSRVSAMLTKARKNKLS